MSLIRKRPEVYVFVLWSEARREERAILADLAEHFTILDLIEVVWTPGEIFASSLSRMYGEALPEGSDKELHCGTGPFLAVIVEDKHPRHRLSRTSHGVKVLNSSISDARQRYRLSTGGGYRVHASDSVKETERNLALFFGKRIDAFRHGPVALSTPSQHPFDPVGTHGWSSTDELFIVLAAYDAHRVSLSGAAPGAMTVRAADVWWVERIAGGREVGVGVREVLVDGKPLNLTILPSGPAPLRAARAIIRRMRPNRL
jgi:hypothetical protein